MSIQRSTEEMITAHVRREELLKIGKTPTQATVKEHSSQTTAVIEHFEAVGPAIQFTRGGEQGCSWESACRGLSCCDPPIGLQPFKEMAINFEKGRRGPSLDEVRAWLKALDPEIYKKTEYCRICHFAEASEDGSSFNSARIILFTKAQEPKSISGIGFLEGLRAFSRLIFRIRR